jgi:DNA-binding NarL/FixJ family response regulator
MAIRLLIADDHEVVRAGLSALFVGESDVEVVAEACDGGEAVRLAHQHLPDVALVDVRMPGLDGLGALAQLRRELPDLAVVMFTAYDNPTYAARALAVGAAGYLVKTAGRCEVLSAVRRAAAGEKLWSRDSVRRLTGALSAPRASEELDAALTRRETDVLRHLAVGLSNKEIALAMEISYETVKEHVQHVLRKLGVADRTQAAVWAVRKGLV